MTAMEVLSELHRRGVSITADGDALVLKPRRAIDGELLAKVREHKPELIRALASRPVTCAPTCYQIERGCWIHRPWHGCTTPMPLTIEPIIPAHADCGCDRLVCRRCWLCAEH